MSLTRCSKQLLSRLPAVQQVVSANYHEKVLDHYENPRNVGSFDKKDKNVGTGLVGAPACGDVMKLQIKVDDEGRITDAKFKTFGCGSAIASSSLATEWVKGKTLDQASSIKNSDIAKELRLPPVKLHCSSKTFSYFRLLRLKRAYSVFCNTGYFDLVWWDHIHMTSVNRTKSGADSFCWIHFRTSVQFVNN